MVNKIGGEGQKKIPPPGEKIKGIPAEEKISRVPPGKKVETEGVREVQEGMGGLPPKGKSEVSIFDVEKIFEQINGNLKELERFHEASLVDPRDAPSLNSWAEENSEKLLEAAIIHAEAAKNWGQFSGGVMSIPGTIIGDAVRYYQMPEKKYIEPLTEEHIIPLSKADLEVMKKVAGGIGEAEFIFKVPETLSKGASLIYKRTVLKMVEKQMLLEEEKLSKAKAPDEKKQMKLKELKAWLKVQNEFLFNEAKAFGIGTFSYYIPKGIATCGKIVGWGGKTIKFATFDALVIVTVAAKSRAVHVARMKRKTHDEWVKRFKEKPIVEEPITSSIKIELSGGEIKRIEIPKAPKEMVDAIDGLLEKRKKAFETCMDLDREEFENLAKQIANSDKTFEEIKGDFKGKGIDFDKLKEPIQSKEGLKQVLNSPEKTEEMLQQYVEMKETITVLTRNGLKGLAERKHKIERKFLNFNLGKASVSLGVSTLAFAAMVTLKVLVFAAIIVTATVALAFTGVGLFVFGIALIVIGLAFLHHHKPNFFNEMIKGVQLRLAMNNIPHSFHNFRLNLINIKSLRKDLELSKMSAQVECLKGFLEKEKIKEADKIPKEVKPLLKKFKLDIDKLRKEKNYDEILGKLTSLEQKEKYRIAEEQKKLDVKIKEIEETVKKWQKRIAPLQERLLNAGFNDFERAANLAKTAPKIVEGKEVPQEELGLENVLVEGLLNDENYLDQPTKKLLKEQLGINLDKLRERNKDDMKKIKKETKEALKTFFAMDDGALIKFIKLQQAKFDFGVLGGTTE